jgi:hypothetical protein
MKYYNIFLIPALCAMCSIASAMTLQTEENAKVEHILSDKPLTPEDSPAEHAAALEEAEAIRQLEQQNCAVDEPACSQAQEEDKLLNSAGYRTSHIASDHKLKKYTFNWDIELEDGSTWQIKPDYLDRLMGSDPNNPRWAYNHTILVLQNHEEGAYRYILLNDTLKETVEAQVLDACLIDSRFALKILDLWTDSRGNGWLKLSDGSKWNLYAGDYDVWNNWRVGHYVFVGTNNVCFLCRWLYPQNILINFSVANRDYVQSSCVK